MSNWKAIEMELNEENFKDENLLKIKYFVTEAIVHLSISCPSVFINEIKIFDLLLTEFDQMQSIQYHHHHRYNQTEWKSPKTQ